LLWQGSFVGAGTLSNALAFIDHRGWRLKVADPETLEVDLRCATVLWYLSDWRPPENFAANHVPLIEQFVKRGGGLLVGGLGWSFRLYGERFHARPGAYGANELGMPFGFAFTLDSFRADPNQPLPLLTR
jgi:hypothetical protein